MFGEDEQRELLDRFISGDELPEVKYDAASLIRIFPGPGLQKEEENWTTEVCELTRQLNIPHPFRRGAMLATREVLDSYAGLQGINGVGLSDQQLAQAVTEKGPCNWIQRVYQRALADDSISRPLNVYVSDLMMGVLNRVRNGVQLSLDEITLVGNVNQAIYSSPRTDKQMLLLRGIHGDPQQPIPAGNIITFDTPKSGTFSPEIVGEGYLGENQCCVMEILVPRNAIASYHPSEDQVIFPTGARFYLLTSSQLTPVRMFGKDDPLYKYQILYIEAPVIPEVINNTQPEEIKEEILPSPFGRISSRDAYSILWANDAAFPYGDRPNSYLEHLYRDPLFLQKFKQGVINSPAEARLYLAAKGYDTRPYQAYDLPQMLQLIR